MGLEGSQSDKLDVRGRLKRYAALRAALRAVSPAFPPETSGALQERAQELSGRLRRAASPDEQPEAAAQTPLHVELDQIDKAWEEFARELLSLVSDLPLSQLRATLPAVQESNPEEVLALLDLCVADERALGERWNLLDYLVTLASTETDDGRKRVALDPATLTPSLEALCAATGCRASSAKWPPRQVEVTPAVFAPTQRCGAGATATPATRSCRTPPTATTRA